MAETTEHCTEFDLAVIGAGPAGLSAAVTAAEHGLRVALVDAGTQPGGQFWRHPDEHHPRPDEGRGQHLWSRFTDLRTRLRGLASDPAAAGRVELVSGHQVWFLEPLAEGYMLHLSATHGETRLPQVRAAALVLCPGGYDRQLPVPGWELPGVVAAGGVQALLKAHRSVAGRRAVVAGTGPFLLPVAVGLAEAGAEVVAVCEAGSLSGWARHPLGAAAVPSKALEAVEYAALLARHRIPYRMRTVVTGIHGEAEVGSVGLGRLDRDGRLRTDVSLPDLDVDLVAFGWGFTPSMELITAVGATTRVDVDESLVAGVDDWQRTDVPGAYVAGEATGVGGALLAIAEGELAALAATRDAGRPVSEPRAQRLQRQIDRGRRFAATMHRAHPVPAGWQDWLEPDTTVCRCEETTLGEICDATKELGATDARTVKLLARPGMGWCQGRVCGFAAAKLAKPVGEALTSSDLAPLAKRTFAAPVSLETLATAPTRSDSATSHDNGA